MIDGDDSVLVENSLDNPCYPSLIKRYLATTLDVAILIFIIISMVKLFEAFQVSTDAWLWYSVFLPVLLYEPFMTSRAATLGQLVFGFRIKDAITNNNINLKQAYGRWVIKFALGGISLLTIPSDAQKRAIHDKLLASVAVAVR